VEQEKIQTDDHERNDDRRHGGDAPVDQIPISERLDVKTISGTSANGMRMRE